MAAKFKTCTSHIKSFDDEKLILKHWISTESQDDGGDVMIASGMEQRGSIVVDFEHGKDPVKGVEPIAKCLSIEPGVNEKGVKGLIATTQFFPDEEGRRLYKKAKEMYMPNWSIEWEPIQGKPVQGGMRYDRWKLLAYSLVKLGMNKDAVTDSNLKFLIKDKPMNEQQKSMASQVGARVARDALDTAHQCMVSALYDKCWDKNCKDEPDAIADALVTEHGPILKEHIGNFVKCYRSLAAESKCKSLAEFKSMFEVQAKALPAPEAPTPATEPVTPPAAATEPETKSFKVDPDAINAALEKALKPIAEQVNALTGKSKGN